MSKTFKFAFTVRGSGEFPLDMLRYDNCVSATPEDQKKIDWKYGDDHPEETGIHYRREVRLISTFYRNKFQRPTAGRWASFTWAISKVEGDE
jgi:hypothetical protein